MTDMGNTTDLKNTLLKESVRVGTWNVQGMYDSVKSHNVILEMNRLDIKIMGISEARWIDCGQSRLRDKVIYYSGRKDSQHLHGVAIVLDGSLQRSVKNFVPFSPRVLLLQLQAYCGTLNLVQVYAPTADKDDEEVESFYKDIDEVMKMTKNKDVTLFLGDMNAKIGQGSCDKWVGPYGLGRRNERGDRFLQFCQENSMVITNTFFKLPKRRLYTWKSPRDSEERIVRNQIDYIIVNHRYRNAVKSAKTYPGADVGSDHNLLVAEIMVRLKKLKVSSVQKPIDAGLLRSDNVRVKVCRDINENLNKLINACSATQSQPEDMWKGFKSAIMEPCEKYLKPERKGNRKEWMTDEILVLMEERRKLKNIDRQKYKETQKDIKHRCRKAKEEWLKEKCTEIENLQRLHDSHNMHKEIKEFTGIGRRQKSYILADEKGNIVWDIKDQLILWEEYIKTLFNDQREEINTGTENETGPSILKEEVQAAIKSTKDGKAPGPDNLPADVLKLIEEQHLDAVTSLFNRIYETGIIPEEWLRSTFVTIPKKHNAKRCEEHRTISLMSHTLKIFLKVIHRRIYRKLEEGIAETQFGFRNGCGTREALFAYNVLMQRCLDVNQNVYVCFIDYNKAFDKVRHKQLIEALEQKNLDTKDKRIIVELYLKQSASVRVQSELTKAVEIKRGVRQGCVLSPLLFNLYSEEIFAKALENNAGGIRVNGIRLNNLRYADDAVLLAENMQDLQGMLNDVITASEEYGLTLNVKKTKYMIVTKTEVPNEHLYVGGERLERVERYNYLGTSVNCSMDYCSEIKIRIEKARASFVKIRKLLCSRDLSLDLRVRMLRCYVFPVLLYGAETWTLNVHYERKLEAFEMWAYRRMLRISWTEHVTNVEVLRRMEKDVEIRHEVKKRKLQYLGHIMRGPRYEILQLIIQGRIVGKRSVGRRRMSWLRNLREWFNVTSSDLFRAAASKVRIVMMIANLRNGDGT